MAENNILKGETRVKRRRVLAYLMVLVLVYVGAVVAYMLSEGLAWLDAA